MKLTEDNIKKVIDKLNEDYKGGIKCPLYAPPSTISPLLKLRRSINSLLTTHKCSPDLLSWIK